MSKFLHVISFLSQPTHSVKTRAKGWTTKLKADKGHRRPKKNVYFSIWRRPDLANDKFTTADGAHSRDNEWKKLGNKLNSLGGAIKDSPKWRKYWKNLTEPETYRVE